MQKQKLDVLVVMFAFGGNGSVGMQLPSITTWFAKNFHQWKQDDRIGRIACITAGDVPLSMERNRTVRKAMDEGFDVILMLDSDNVPDLYAGHDPAAKPFWETSFNFLYERSCRGLPTVVCAPYCGPPPHPTHGGQENVYVFYAEGNETPANGSPSPGIKFTAYSRDHAAIMTGIQPIAAGPTGVIMYSTDAFKLMPTKPDVEAVLNDVATGKIGVGRAKELLAMESWFYYEYVDGDCTHKASTEDCTNTREIQLAGIQKHGQPIVFCNWDSWAGHYKPKCVGKPNPLRIEQVSSVFAEAVRSNLSVEESAVMLDLPDIVFDDVVREYEPSTVPVKPAATKPISTLIFGRKFAATTLTKQDCVDLREALHIARGETVNDRVLIIGDSTGEIAWTANSPSIASSVYVIVDGPVKANPIGGPLPPDGWPIGMPQNIKLAYIGCEELDPQELKIIVARHKPGANPKDVCDWGRRHLAKDGTMLICGAVSYDTPAHEWVQWMESAGLSGGSKLGSVLQISYDDFYAKVESDVINGEDDDDLDEDFDDEYDEEDEELSDEDDEFQ